MRKFLSAAAIAALLVGSVSPAYAHRSAVWTPQAPQGATATLNFKVPLGTSARAQKASYGVTLGFGQKMDSVTDDGRVRVRDLKLADIRFNASSMKLQKAELVSVDLANLENDKRLNMMEGKDSTTWIIIGLVVAGATVWILTDDDDDDDNDSIE